MTVRNILPGVEIHELAQVNPSDQRGETWQWSHGQAIVTVVCRRKAGSVSCHVHKGDDLSKNPEQLFIAQGRVKFTFVLEAGDRAEVFVEAGSAVLIGPGVVHHTEVLEDAIILESRKTVFDPSNTDTYPAEI